MLLFRFKALPFNLKLYLHDNITPEESPTLTVVLGLLQWYNHYHPHQLSFSKAQSFNF